MKDIDENTKKRFQIPEGAMRLIKRGDSPVEDLDEGRFMGEYEVAKNKTD